MNLEADKENSTFYYANGKLLLTAEYLVLCGAKALAFPVVYGQSMEVQKTTRGKFEWIAFDQTDKWLHLEFSLEEIKSAGKNIQTAKDYLLHIFYKMYLLKPARLDNGSSYKFITRTNYPMKWGLGSSSTLIYNLALWLECDVYELYKEVSKGSGYDIACAGMNSPLLYKLDENSGREIEKISFQKDFSGSVAFLYSGRKMKTEETVRRFIAKGNSYTREVEEVSLLTDKVLRTQKLEEFICLLREHERIIAGVTGQSTVQEIFFSDFDGIVKSLGAWGGDFYLVASTLGMQYIKEYFEQFELKELIPFEKMIK